MDKEQEIRLQFLEEAQAYLDTIESAFLDMATLAHRNQIDAVLRSAHSIKGGAAMMGLEVLSELAHRFEDFFKILKYNRESVELDTDLEDLMLAGIDALRQIVQQYRRGSQISQTWLETQVEPMMDQLQKRLGDFHPGDATLAMVEEDQDMTVLLFETEVEASLQRLETLLDTPGQPCLLEEVKIMAQELGGLGEMLELDPFIQLCQSVYQHLEAVPHRAEEIAQLGVMLWRRSQSLILVQQKRLLPTQLILPGLEEDTDTPSFDPHTHTIGTASLPELPSLDDLDLSDLTQDCEDVEAAEPLEDSVGGDAAEWRPALAVDAYTTLVPDPDTVIYPPHPVIAPPLEAPALILLGPISDPAELQIHETAARLDLNDLDQVSFLTDSLFNEDVGLNLATESAILLNPTELAELMAEDPAWIPCVDTWIQPETDWLAEDLVDESIRLDEPCTDLSEAIAPAVEQILDPTVLELVEHRPTDRALELLDQEAALATSMAAEEAIAEPWAMQLEPLPTEPLPAENAADLMALIQDSLENLLGPETEPPTGPLRVAQASAPTPAVLESPEPPPAPIVKREREVLAPADASSSGDLQDNTVRVSVRQLDQINDLFGELAIERNGLDLHLSRLRNLVSLLSYRTQSLEKSNTRLRTAYDQVATRGGVTPGMVAAVPTLVASMSALRRGWSAPNSDPNLPPELRSLGHKFDILELDRYSDLNLLSQEVMETIVQIQEVTGDIELSLEDANQTTRSLNRTAKQLQVNLTQVRMRPLSDVLNRFPRALRELCAQYGKKVELKTYGVSTLFDRTVLESLSDPLMHLLRNSFDHGIEDEAIRRERGKPETGLIEIRAAHRGNQTIITVSDDGGGIDLAKIRVKALQMGLDMEVIGGASDRELLDLIFEPGFSTATEVTALSGRGVGMDVVRTNLKQVRGEVKVETQLRRGTTFTITVPFTLSVMRVLLVESQGILMAFPKDAIEEVLLLNPQQVFTTAGNEFLRWEGGAIPLLHLHHWLQFNCPYRAVETEAAPIINQPTILMVVQADELRGIRIERCWGEQEVTVRQVEGNLSLPAGFAGCTILGDGRVVPLVDPPTLLRQVMEQPRVKAAASQPLEASLEAAYQLPSARPVHSQPTILVIDDSIVVRRFLALTLERAGYRVEQAKDGQDALERLLAGLQVQAIMCDIEMPRLDGYGFLARVKSDPALHNIPISMLTSRSGDKHRQLAMRLGAAAYFSKPYKEQELLQTLKQLIQDQTPVLP